MNLTVDMINEGLSYVEVMMIYNLKPVQESVWELYCSLSTCLNLFWFRGSACFAYDRTIINQHRVEKSAFEDQSEENSVWIIQWTTLFGIISKISFTPAVTSCYQVHTYLRRCYATCLEPFRFHMNCFHFLKEPLSFMCGRHNCVRKMVFRFICAVLWKLHG